MSRSPECRWWSGRPAIRPRTAVAAVDPNQPISSIQTVERVLSDSVARERFSAILLGIFAAVALVLAVIGIYGVMVYSVAQRTHETGIQMALGAEATDVRRLVVLQGMRLALAGSWSGCWLRSSRRAR